MYRILVALQFVHVIALFDLIAATYMRFDHYGQVCFFHPNGQQTERDPNAIPEWLAYGLEVYMAVLWATVLVYLIAIVIVCCSVCKTRIRNARKHESVSPKNSLSEDLQKMTTYTEEHES